jgi:4'-phosphopantetheinyl transferase
MVSVQPNMHITTSAYEFPPSLTLAPNEVQVWRIDLREAALDAGRWESLLSTDELEHAHRFRFSRDRCHYAAVRGSLRSILAAYLNERPCDLTFSYSAAGKPALASPWSDSGIQFNVSHSGGAALLAFARRREVGIDIEKIRRDVELEGIARRFFSLREQEQLTEIDPNERYEAFFRCWTRKEAYLKATGAGLSLPLSQFDVSILPKNRHALLATRPDPREAERWTLTDIPAGDAFVAALCVEGLGWNLRGWSQKSDDVRTGS